MPYKQSHRGQHPEDARLFGEKCLPILREAVADLSFLLTRGYADKSAIKIVGDRYQLDARQRHGIQRCACSDEAVENRNARRMPVAELDGRTVAIDGYNLLITTEAALAGGVLLRGRDGCVRDLASLHGSYRRVEETHPAIELIGKVLTQLNVGQADWYFDAPVSNSGRLKGILEEKASEHAWPWRVELAPNPDPVLAESDHVVVTADSWILDRAKAWSNMAEAVVDALGRRPRIIDLA